MRGYREHEVSMAVGCQLIVRGRVSGVLHSCAPGADEVMAVDAARGGCRTVVDGSGPVVSMLVERKEPHAISTVSPQNEGPDEGPLLTAPQARELADAALAIERYYKRPQDIEWSFDGRGKLHILQTRPLRLPETAAENPAVAEAVPWDAEVIFEGRGLVAQRGVASGPVRLVRSDADLESFSVGAILVARHTSPRYSRVMRQAHGIITDVGSPTGHMATIAREFRVPTLVNAGVATALLREGEEITLDTTRNAVFRGRIGAVDRFELTEDDAFEDSYEYRLLRRLLKHIAPLNLVDPHGENFVPSACRTFHDITRYIHESAVEALIHLSERRGADDLSSPRRLLTSVPLGLLLVNGGDGVECPPESETVRPEQIVSLPLREFLAGMDACGMWCTEPVSVGLGSFMASVTRTFSASLAGPEAVGRNLVVVLRNYMNLNMRLGYHFNIIDAYCSDELNDNYIYFRFLGGVTEFIRRSRRARFVAEVLERYDFRVEIHGDLVVGRVKKLDAARMARRLRMLGGLVGYARQLDARLHSEGDVARHVRTFLEAMRDSIGGEHEE